MITTKNIKQTSKEYFKILVMINIKKRWWIFVLLWLLALVNIIRGRMDTFNIFFIVFSIVYPLLYLAYLFWFANSKDNKLYFIERYYDIYEDKIIGFLSDGTESPIKLEYFVRVLEMKNYYLLYISKAQFVYLPKDSFKSEQDKDWFENNILAKIQIK